MHDIRAIRDDPDAFDRGLARRGLPPQAAALVALDDARKGAVGASQGAQERRNALSREIGAAKKARDEARASDLMAEVASLKDATPALDAAVREAEAALREALAGIPNLPNPDVPDGADEHGNVERHRVGEPPRANGARQHFELGEASGLMDFEAAARLSGARFVVLKGQLARLERALGQFMLDLHTGEHGYTEVNPPLLVNDEAMFGTAQLPKFEDDQFGTTERSLSDARAIFDEKVGPGQADTIAKRIGIETEVFLDRLSLRRRFWLVPTAEVPLTNLAREQILAEDALPLRYTALTPCFRAEAGAAGRDTRGMIRQHQFTKCELVSITTPDQSADEHERMLAAAEAVLKRLELPYRVMTLCTGDMGFASAKTYDIEVWLPGQGAYREISSCSVCNDFQARRMDARYRPKDREKGGGPRHVHTLNGSGVAVGRALVAVMENYQEPDGGIRVPSALAPYMGGITRIEGA